MEVPAVKFTVLSGLTMGIPKTIVDFSRNDAMGWESVRYEAGGIAFNYLLPGFIAFGIAKAAEKFISPSGVSSSFWIDNNNIDALYANWKNSGNNTYKFIENTLKEIRVEGQKPDFSNEIYTKYAKQLEIIIKGNGLTKKGQKRRLGVIKRNLSRELGTRDRIDLKSSGINTSVDKLVDNIFDLSGKIFTSSEELTEKAIQKLKRVNNIKTIGALGLAGALTFSLQYINRFITKKQTGIEGYVGYSDLKQDKHDVSFKGYGFDGFYPNNTQIAGFMAPASYIGTVAASRDQNEFKEKAIRGGVALVNLFFIPGIAGKVAGLFTKYKDEIHTEAAKLSNIFTNKIKSYNELDAYAWKKAKGNRLDYNQVLRRLKRSKNVTKFAELAYALIAVGLAVPLFTKGLVDINRDRENYLHSKNSFIQKNSTIINNMLKNTDPNSPFAEFIRNRA